MGNRRVEYSCTLQSQLSLYKSIPTNYVTNYTQFFLLPILKSDVSNYQLIDI